MYVYVYERFAKFGCIRVYLTCMGKCLKNVFGQCKPFTGPMIHMNVYVAFKIFAILKAYGETKQYTSMVCLCTSSLVTNSISVLEYSGNIS